LHWINRDFLSIKGIEKILKLGKPVYWVLHDMWAMTGGCHHSFECNKYETHCGNCPNLIKPSAKDSSYHLFEKKLEIFDKYKNLQIITPSKWLGECAKKSRLFSKKNIQVIPNVMDTSIYKPIDKSIARSIFKLSDDKKIILFGAVEGTINPYKGWNYLLEALKHLAQTENNIEAFIFGSEHSQTIVDAVPFPVHFSGHLNDDESLCMLYNAADVFVASSLADNFPNTIVESLACGTPVVGFNVGGIPDLVDHKRTGYLARYKDSNDLAEGIRWVLNCKEDLGKNACNKIEIMMTEVTEGLKTKFRS
jgi:glycosyltransferase involved in cell wall biosynthesis